MKMSDDFDEQLLARGSAAEEQDERQENVSEALTLPPPRVRAQWNPRLNLTLPPLAGARLRWPARRKLRGDRFQDWQNWSKFRLWRHTRPLWGALLMILAGALMLIGASFFLSLAFLVQSIWPAFLVGGLLLVMGILPLFLPSYAVITGSIGMVLSIVSLLVASFGACGLGLLLGVIGSALCIAWRPVKRSRLIGVAASPRT